MDQNQLLNLIWMNPAISQSELAKLSDTTGGQIHIQLRAMKIRKEIDRVPNRIGRSTWVWFPSMAKDVVI